MSTIFLFLDYLNVVNVGYVYRPVGKGNGGRYRYYRCTKERENVVQKYLVEHELARQVKEQLQSISLPETVGGLYAQKVEEFEHEEINASESRLRQFKEDLKTLEAKLSALVDLHLNGDIEREIYLTKKTRSCAKNSRFKQNLHLPEPRERIGSNPCGNGFWIQNTRGFWHPEKISTR